VNQPLPSGNIERGAGWWLLTGNWLIAAFEFGLLSVTGAFYENN